MAHAGLLLLLLLGAPTGVPGPPLMSLFVGCLACYWPYLRPAACFRCPCSLLPAPAKSPVSHVCKPGFLAVLPACLACCQLCMAFGPCCSPLLQLHLLDGSTQAPSSREFPSTPPPQVNVVQWSAHTFSWGVWVLRWRCAPGGPAVHSPLPPYTVDCLGGVFWVVFCALLQVI